MTLNTDKFGNVRLLEYFLTWHLNDKHEINEYSNIKLSIFLKIDRNCGLRKLRVHLRHTECIVTKKNCAVHYLDKETL